MRRHPTACSVKFRRRVNEARPRVVAHFPICALHVKLDYFRAACNSGTIREPLVALRLSLRYASIPGESSAIRKLSVSVATFRVARHHPPADAEQESNFTER